MDENKKNRYAFMERVMCIILAVLLVLFVIFLIASGCGISWLKGITSILTILTSLLCLAYLYLTHELLRSRSLWISTAFAGILICVVFSLILQFPCPKP